MKIIFDSEEIKTMLLSQVALKLNMSPSELSRTAHVSMVNTRAPSLSVDLNSQQIEVEINE